MITSLDWTRNQHAILLSSSPYPVWWAPLGAPSSWWPEEMFQWQHEANSEMLPHSPEQLEALASDRQIWRDTCDSSLVTFLVEYESVAENHCVRCHQPATVTFSGYRLPDCNRSCASAIGLYSHRRTHRRWLQHLYISNIDGLPQASKHTLNVYG